jgi:bacterioferritin
MRMKGDTAVVRALNATLKAQLTAINQFFLHARMLRNWGLDRLNEAAHARSIKAMKLADRLVERILFLEGLPNLQDLGKLLIGEDAAEILRNDLRLQGDIRADLATAVTLCEEAGDFVTRALLVEVQEATEDHIDWLESQLWLIDHTGVDNYLQSGI